MATRASDAGEAHATDSDELRAVMGFLRFEWVRSIRWFSPTTTTSR